jgi:3-oxoacid CoA-transferase subunit B
MIIPGKMIKGMGGAMDLVAGAQRVIVMMTHNSTNDDAKLLKECNLPLTGRKCVQHVITDLGWFDIEEQDGKHQLVLKEIAPGETVEGVREHTDAEFTVAEDLITM